MAGRLILTTQVELQIPGEPPLEFGNKGQVYAVNVSGLTDPWRGSIANNTTVTLWDATTSSISSWEFFIIKSDQDLLVEFTGTTTADNNAIKIRAGWPVYRTLDDCLAYAASGNFGGAAQVVTKIKARNTSGTTAIVSSFVVL